MIKRPAFQFYPDKWTGNNKLRSCNHEEKGVWMDLLCYLHYGDEYGVTHKTLEQLSKIIHCKLEVVEFLYQEEILKGAPEGKNCSEFIYAPISGGRVEIEKSVILIPQQPGPIYYCSRMVRDEHLRNIRSGNGRIGGKKKWKNYQEELDELNRKDLESLNTLDL